MRDRYGRREVPGFGPSPSSLMIVAEAPGQHEDRVGRPLVGQTGKETSRLLTQARLSIRDFFLTNVVRFRPHTNKPTGNSAPTMDDIRRDEPKLIAEIKRVKPKWILALGRVAASWFFEKEIDIEDCEGFAFPDLPRARGAVVIVVRHPAAGFHSPEQQPIIYWGFQRFGQFVRGELDPHPPVDEFPDPNYYEVKYKLASSPRNSKIAVDTEGVLGSAWCLTYSMLSGTGGLVLRKNKEAIDYARELLFHNDNTVALHNSPWDMRILAELFKMPLLDLMRRLKFEDTMQLAYTLRLLPKGLKALGRRFKGVEMEDYKSIVADADRRIMIDWFREVLKFRCSVCNGMGATIEQPISEKTGKMLAERLVDCGACRGDGTGWEPPAETIDYNQSNGKLTISSGRRMGWRVRNVLKDVDKIDPETGKQTELRKRWNEIKKKNYDFAVQVEERLGAPRPVSLEDIPFDEALTYAVKDADVTKRIWPDLEAEVDREGLRGVYEMDRDVIPMITQMMNIGWKIDVPYLNQLTNRLSIQQDKISYQLEQLVGRPINPNSPKQVGEVLFDDLGLHPVRLTDSGAESTDGKVLADLRIFANVQKETADSRSKRKRYNTAYEFISNVLDWKERGKIKSSYTTTLPHWIDDKSRVHPTISNTSTESGRLTVRDPALQTLPVRTENGKLVRGAFVCGEGNVLLEADFSQIEFRLMAHAANDKRLIKAINSGVDPHNLTTSKIFGIPIDKVEKDSWQRYAAKRISFAILYGASAPTVKMNIKLDTAKHTLGGMDVPVEECERWIDDYRHRTFPAIGEFMADSEAEARRNGYVADMWGRRRYLPGVHSPIGKVRAEAERIATNHKVQSGAQGIAKHSMIVAWNDILPKFRDRGFCECILQVHDSLIFEVKKELAEELMRAVLKVMRGVVKLRIPLDVDAKIGLRWDRLEAIKAA